MAPDPGLALRWRTAREHQREVMRSTSAVRPNTGIRESRGTGKRAGQTGLLVEDEGGAVNRLADERCMPAAEPKSR
jgi:hypothetical protein